jgi:hypothetical protein
MKPTELPAEVQDYIKRYHIGMLLEKHESWSWSIQITYSAFFTFDGYEVLLPIQEEDRANVSLLWLAVGAEGNLLTLYIEDTTTWNSIQNHPFYKSESGDESMKRVYTDFVVICEQVPGQAFYIATFCHKGILSRQPGSGPLG